MRYYIIAGEPSGDKYGALLMKSLKELDECSVFRYWGGSEMLKTEPDIAMELSKTAFMGFAEVVKNLPAIWRLFTFAKNDILAFQPDVVILIDYPGFNLRMAKWLKNKGFKVVYYIAPQVWAWKEHRVKILEKYIDLLITILPFEQQYFAQFDIPQLYIGHPLLDVQAIFDADKDNQDISAKKDKILALLPGSRKQEIIQVLPIMLKAASRMEGYHTVISKMLHIPDSHYTKVTDHFPGFTFDLVIENSFQILKRADLAAVTSGTATLEAALYKVPQVVCYKTSLLSYWIGKWVIRLPYISLVNLICQKSVVPELIQNKLTPQSLIQALYSVEKKSTTILEDYLVLENLLGNKGASDRAAKAIWQLIKINESENIPN